MGRSVFGHRFHRRGLGWVGMRYFGGDAVEAYCKRVVVVIVVVVAAAADAAAAVDAAAA